MNIYIKTFLVRTFLVGIGQTTHTTHDSENVVVNGIDVHIRTNRCICYKFGGVDTREVACSTGLVIFGAKSEGVYVDTSIGCAGVVLEGLDSVEVAAFTFREAILSV